MIGMLEGAENCSVLAQQFVGICTVIIYAPLALVYIIVAVMFIKHPNSFHPFFVLSFFLILLAYTISNFILFFRNLIEFMFYDEILFKSLEFTFTYANYYTQPIIVLALLERLVATLRVSKYEKSRYWIAYFIGQVLCIAVVVLMGVSGEESELLSNIQFSLSLIICAVLIVLFIVNRQMTSNAVGKLSLTTRYQLAENVKALRIFVPFIFLDNIISIMFIFSNLVFSVSRRFEEDECIKSPYYFIYFTIFRTCAIIMQISMAVLVFRFHDSMKIPIFPCSKTRTLPEEMFDVTKQVYSIKNVLGKNIVEKETAENYFSQLQTQWK